MEKKSRRQRWKLFRSKVTFCRIFKALICPVSLDLINSIYREKKYLLFYPVSEVNGGRLLSQYKQTFIYYLCNMRVSFSRIIELAECVCSVKWKIDNRTTIYGTLDVRLVVHWLWIFAILKRFFTFSLRFSTRILHSFFLFYFWLNLMTFCNILMTTGFPRPSVKVNDECVSWFNGWFDKCVQC